MTAAQWAAKNDYWISKRGMTVTLWRPARTVTGGTPAESLPASLGSTVALVLMGADAAQMATLAGLDPNQAAQAFFLSALAPVIVAGLFLEDSRGRWWRIHSTPDAQGADPAGDVIGTSALLALQSQQPAGIPQMAAYLETLVNDVRAGILAGAGELTVDGIYESEHADTVAWSDLPLPYAAVVVSLDAAPEWGITSNAFTAAIDVYLVYSQLGGSAGLRAKLEAVRDAFASTERLTQGTTLEVSGLSWKRDLAPNQQLAADPSRRAGLVTIQAVVGERP